MMLMIFALGLVVGSYLPRLLGRLLVRTEYTQLRMRSAARVPIDVLIDQAIGRHPVTALPRQRGSQRGKHVWQGEHR